MYATESEIKEMADLVYAEVDTRLNTGDAWRAFTHHMRVIFPMITSVGIDNMWKYVRRNEETG